MHSLCVSVCSHPVSFVSIWREERKINSQVPSVPVSVCTYTETYTQGNFVYTHTHTHIHAHSVTGTHLNTRCVCRTQPINFLTNNSCYRSSLSRHMHTDERKHMSNCLHMCRIFVYNHLLTSLTNNRWIIVSILFLYITFQYTLHRSHKFWKDFIYNVIWSYENRR